MQNAPGIHFDFLLYSLFSIQENSINSEYDPDINFYQDVSPLEKHYCTPNDFQKNLQCFAKDSF